jgi:hypothetical protein
MDHAKLRGILERMTAVLTHLAGRHYGAPIRPQVEQIGAAVKALKDDSAESGGLADRVKALEAAVADLHAALSDKPSPAAVQKAVADVEVPQPNG